MNYTQYYENQITEKIDQEERKLWQEFYTKRLPKRTEKFKRKYTGKPEELPKAIEEFEARTAGEYSEVIDEKLTTICGDMREKFYHEILAKLDQFSAGMPDKANCPKLDKQTIASEIIADQEAEIKKLKAELLKARNDVKAFEDDWEFCSQQKSILMLQIDIINFALKIFDYKCLKMALSFVKAAYNQQPPEKDDEQEVEE